MAVKATRQRGEGVIMDKNVCPYCGSSLVKVITRCSFHSIPALNMRAICSNEFCGLVGPFVQLPAEYGFSAAMTDATIDAAFEKACGLFAHPAHLHTYDPATEIKVSRFAANYASTALKRDGLHRAGNAEADAEFRAALESK